MAGVSQRAVIRRVRLPRAHRQGPAGAGARPRGGRLGQFLVIALLVAACAVVLVIAIGQLGGATSAARVEREVVTATKGVVQSTVTGTGNVEPVTDEDVDFQTSGTLEHVYVKVGQRVRRGQLLATLDPASAQLTLDQAEEQLTAGEDTLASAEASSSTTSTTGSTTASTPTTSTGAGPGSSSSGLSTGDSSSATTTSGNTSTSTTSTSSAATIASDELIVEQEEETVKTDEAAEAETKLRAPAAGTIVSLESLSPGDTVSSGTDSSGSSSESASSDTSSTDTQGSSADSSSSSSSSSGFAEIASLHRLSMTVAFDESDISKLKVGQTATVTLDALTGVELAAKVTAISPLGTTSDSVVSYDATLTLEQQDARVEPGMSASAAVIVDQGQGVTVPNDAVSGTSSLGAVTEDVDGKVVSRQVVVGLRGDSRTVIDSGLKAGDQVVITTTLPSETATTSTSSGSTGTLGGTSGAGAATLGGGFAGAGAGRGGPP
jgi:membrane fusion protein, macrolide-specific efflux system